MNTSVYILEFPDGRTTEYTANAICECLWDQVDAEENDIGLFDEIIGHRTNPKIAVNKKNGTYFVNGNERKVITTKGWDLHIR